MSGDISAPVTYAVLEVRGEVGARKWSPSLSGETSSQDTGKESWRTWRCWSFTTLAGWSDCMSVRISWAEQLSESCVLFTTNITGKRQERQHKH